MDVQWLLKIDRLLQMGKRDEARLEVDEAAAKSPDADAYVLLGHFLLSYYSGERDKAWEMAQAAREAALGAQNKLAEAYALVACADAHGMFGRYGESRSLAAEALKAAQAAHDESAEAQALRSQATALLLLGRYEDSLSAATDALKATRAAGPKLDKTNAKLDEANALRCRADVLRMLGRYEESVREAVEAVNVAQEAEAAEAVKVAEAANEPPASRAKAQALRSQADALRMLTCYEDSLSIADHAVQAANATGNEFIVAYVRGSKAHALRMLGQYGESLDEATKALRAARDAGHGLAVAIALKIQADAFRMLGQCDESLRAAADATTAAQAAGDKVAEADALVSKLLSLCELGKKEDRDEVLDTLADLDPARARRVATYPVHSGWCSKVSAIFAHGQQREAELREVLYAESNQRETEVPEGFDGEFHVLREWASYARVDLMRPSAIAPSPGRRHTGGGYFLWWRGLGLVIDPGLGFGEAYRSAGLLPRDISAVVATHHHIDHTGDMLPILTCLFEMNQEPLPAGVTQHQVDFLLAPGAFSAFAGVVAYVPGVRSIRLLRPRKGTDLPLPGGAKATVTAVKAEHRDLTGRADAAIGLRMDLPTADGRQCSVGLSGDTRFVQDSAEAFNNVDLMVVHIGSIYGFDVGEVEPPPWHLGFSGTVRLLQEIKRHSREDWDPLVLVSEWGEELERDRSDICKEVHNSTQIRQVFPAEWKQRVVLKAGQARPICARNDGRLADHWHVTETGDILYLCGDHDRS